MVEMISEQQSVLAHKKGIELVVSINRDVPVYVIGDHEKFEQILNNIIGNAIKFTERGEVYIGVDQKSVDNGSVIIKFVVKDTGIGVPADKHKEVFDRFIQVDSTLKRKYEGTGLGVAISKQLIEMMGGEIWLESEVEKGSSFIFTIVFKKVDDVQEEIFPVIQNGSQLKVLIVEDNATSRIVLTETLSWWGINATAVDNGLEAIKILTESESSGIPFNLVLLDIMMPGIDGPGVVKEIEKSLSNKDLKIVMLSYSNLSVEDEDISNRIDSYLLKPVKQSALYNTILKVLDMDALSEDGADKSDFTESLESKCTLSVLLIEDNIVNQEVARVMLVQMGHMVTMAENGEEGIALWKEGDYDIILMDINMPIMDGIEATKIIRKIEREKSGEPSVSAIPIIALTACNMAGDRERCLDAGMNDFIAKPIILEKFRKKLDSLTLKD